MKRGKLCLCLVLVASAACTDANETPQARDTESPTSSQFDGAVAPKPTASRPIAKATDTECRKACWNYNKIMFGAKTDKLIEGLGADEAANLRAGRERAYQEIRKHENDPGLQSCVANCQAAASNEQVACMQAAELPEVLKGCMSH